MSEKELIVRDFIAAWSEGDARKLADFFAEDAVVWNDGHNTVRGRDAIYEHYVVQLSACKECDFEITRSAVAGNTVFNERIDRMKVAGAPVELPVAGVFEVDDSGSITAWRDYFDLNTVMTQVAAGMPGNADEGS